MTTSLLILAYYSYRDPVFQSAVLPYFLNFPGTKFQFVLLTFEHQKYPLDRQEIKKIENFLLSHRIIWKRSQWRSGPWKPLKKILDFISAVLVARQLVKQYKICAIYSEGFPGAILGHYASLVAGCKHIIHSFEPHADYMVEAGVWKETSWETKLLRWHEIKVAHRATYIFTATRLMIERLIQQGVNPAALWRVPSCVDLQHFEFSTDSRVKIRNRYGLRDHTPVLVYLGKFGGMYMEEEAFQFFKLCQDEMDAFIMVLTPDPIEKISRLSIEHSLQREKMVTKFLNREDIPSYLSAADMGLVAVRQWPSKRYCSPIKTGEYLANGLPVVVPLGISDDVEMLVHQGIGIAMKSLDRSALLDVIQDWKSFIKVTDRNDLQKRARNYAREDRSIDRFKELYGRLFDRL